MCWFFLTQYRLSNNNFLQHFLCWLCDGLAHVFCGLAVISFNGIVICIWCLFSMLRFYKLATGLSLSFMIIFWFQQNRQFLKLLSLNLFYFLFFLFLRLFLFLFLSKIIFHCYKAIVLFHESWILRISNIQWIDFRESSHILINMFIPHLLSKPYLLLPLFESDLICFSSHHSCIPHLFPLINSSLFKLFCGFHEHKSIFD